MKTNTCEIHKLQWNPDTSSRCPNCIAEEKERGNSLVGPAKAGYYKALVAQKVEENSTLKEQRGWLLEQVSFLRKTVAFLEARRRELENGISQLEKQVHIGISIMEQLEDNKEFEQVSGKIEKKNK